VSELDVVKGHLNFVRKPSGVMHIPVRVFPDTAALERLTALAQKYMKQLPA